MGIFRLFKRHKPKINVQSPKKEGFSGWVKCSGCTEMIHSNELDEYLQCCPKCGYHFRIGPEERINNLADEGTFQEMFTSVTPVNPLGFVDSEKYDDRLTRAQKKSGVTEAVRVGPCCMDGREVMLGVLDFNFMGGSMGSVVGERITCMVEHAIERHLPVIMVCCSGGARMQESVFSLMQMAKTSAAFAKLAEKKLPYISVLTNPTTGGVTASFASLGDIILAEPGALIGFAGPRVIEQTMREKLPESAQKSEFLLEKGMIDGIVSRGELKKTLLFFIDFLTNNTSTKRSVSSPIDELVEISQKNRSKNKIEVLT